MPGLLPRALVAALLVGACARPAPTTVVIAPSPEAPVPAPVAPGEPALPPGEAAAQEEVAEKDSRPAEQIAPDPGRRAWLGVELEPPGPGEAGARVARVVPKSPAERDGLLAGDLIVKLDDLPVQSPQEVIALVASQPAGARMAVAVSRLGKDRLVPVTLGAFPERDQIYRLSFVDQPAPPFEQLRTARGNLSPTLAAQRGQVVVVEFWAPWCGACRALIPHMNQWHARYAARGLRVIGITNEPVARAAAAATELGMEYAVASDASGRTIRAYQASAIPAVFVIDRGGTVRDVLVGYDGRRLAQLDTLVERLVAEP